MTDRELLTNMCTGDDFCKTLLNELLEAQPKLIETPQVQERLAGVRKWLSQTPAEREQEMSERWNKDSD